MTEKSKKGVNDKEKKKVMTAGKAGGIAAGAILLTALICGLLIYFLVGPGSPSSSGGGGGGSFSPGPTITPDPTGTATPPPDPAPPGAMVYRQAYWMRNTSFARGIACDADPDFFGGVYTGFCFNNNNNNVQLLPVQMVNQNNLPSVDYIRSGDVIDIRLDGVAGYDDHFPALLTRNAIQPADGNIMFLADPNENPGVNVKSVFFQIWLRNRVGIFGDYIETGDALRFSRVDANNLGVQTTDYFYAIPCGHDTANPAQPWVCEIAGTGAPIAGSTRMGKFFNYNLPGSANSFEFVFTFEDI
jgi:hypothetical protein